MEPIRVLHLLHTMNRGGAENSLMNYYRHIDKNTVQFDFLLTDPNKTSFEDEIVSLGGKIFRVPLLTIKNPFPYLNGVYSFFKQHPEYRIVHSHTSSKSVIPLFIAKLCGIPIRCCHSHRSKSEGGLNGLLRDFLKPFLKIVATDYLSCGVQAAIWLYGQKFYDKGHVRVFKNVIESDKFRFNKDLRKEYRSLFGFDDEVIALGHTARFSVVKNHLFDLEILSSLLNNKVKAKLLLVGGGEQEEKIRQKAKELNVLGDVIFAGIVPNVYDIEQAMDVFLLPSFNEGLPLSIIEAQTSGLPCFTSMGVSRECSVTDLVNYISLDDGANNWAKAIMSKLSCFNRYDHYSEIAEAGYDAKTSAKELQLFYLDRYYTEKGKMNSKLSNL